MQQSGLVKEGEVFFKQWLRSPKSMGSIIPSSRFLANAIADQVAWRPGQHVIELGGGTGAITQGLLDKGIPAENLLVVELETHLFEYLRDRFKSVNVIQGDATRLNEILERQGITNVGTVISGLPMVQMSFEFQQAIVEQSFAAMRDRGPIVQYSYSPVTPVPAKRLGINAKLARYVMLNVPPATVWRYTR